MDNTSLLLAIHGLSLMEQFTAISYLLAFKSASFIITLLVLYLITGRNIKVLFTSYYFNMALAMGTVSIVSQLIGLGMLAELVIGLSTIFVYSYIALYLEIVKELRKK